MTTRDKFIFVVQALKDDPPVGFHCQKDPRTMDDATLFAVMLIGLSLLYMNTRIEPGDASVNIFDPTSQPPVDPGQPEPPAPGPGPAQTGNAEVVAKAIQDLQAAGRDTFGPCGALAITNLVAWRLRPRYGLLRKPAGNRGVPRADGSCLSGDETNEEGFATDYLIDNETGYGYDLLGDGGGANNPQWNGPETDPVFVQRNRENFRPPFDPGL